MREGSHKHIYGPGEEKLGLRVAACGRRVQDFKGYALCARPALRGSWNGGFERPCLLKSEPDRRALASFACCGWGKTFSSLILGDEGAKYLAYYLLVIVHFFLDLQSPAVL